MINMVISISNLLVGLFMILLCIPLKNRSVKMNRWYGFRLEKSFESDDAWYKINEYGAKRMIFWSIPLIVVGVLSLLIPFNGNIVLILIFSFFPLVVIIPVIECYLFAQTL